jgi:hypothetical protein
MEKIQACIAQVAKYQFDPSVQITQLTMLTLLLEVAASLHHQNPEHTAQKLRQLQTCLDDCEDWHNVKSNFLVPIKKEPSAAKTVSGDTQAILRMGEGEGEMDYLVMTFMTKMELRSLVYVHYKTLPYLFICVYDEWRILTCVQIYHQRFGQLSQAVITGA